MKTKSPPKMQVISTLEDDPQKELEKKMSRGDFVNQIQELCIDIPSYEEKIIDRNSVVYYKINIQFKNV